MAEKIRHELMSFLKPSGLAYKILVVETLAYLPKLREYFPNAVLYAVADEAERFEDYQDLGVEFRQMDYLSEPLPFEKASLDYILSDLTLEQAGNPQDIAAGFSQFLKEMGSFLTSFRNIRHWSVLEELAEGHYYHVGARLFALPEFETLLSASYYKNFTARSQRREPAGRQKAIVEGLVAADWAKPDDMMNEFYFVKADRSMPELAILKGMYEAGERKEISRLLHRIEYGVETEKSVMSLWSLYARLQIFPAYIASFINETVFHHVRFYRHLWAASDAAERETVRQILDEGIEGALSETTEAVLREVWSELMGEV